MNQLMNESVNHRGVIEQPLALPGSAKYTRAIGSQCTLHTAPATVTAPVPVHFILHTEHCKLHTTS